MTSSNMRAIQTVTVGSGGAANITFSSIPQTYTDLYVVVSGRSISGAKADALYVRFNGSSTGYSNLVLYGETTGTGSFRPGPPFAHAGYMSGSGTTSNVFGNSSFYIANYTSNVNKVISADAVTEDNLVGYQSGIQAFTAATWANSAAITSIVLTTESAQNFAQYSTATLYGVYNTLTGGAKATGGYVSQDSTYWYHTFLASGTFTPTQSLTVDSLVIAGGGGGGKAGGGGGAGSIIYNTGFSLSATNYTVTVGAGGAGATTRNNQPAPSGSSSSFNSTVATGGGGGASNNGTIAGGAGGSGGGAVNDGAAGTASAGTLNGGTGYVNIGGGGVSGGNLGQGGGGSGVAGGTQSAPNGGFGGNGTTAFSSWGLATITGQNVAGTVYYAGGGGGYSELVNSGGLGGGGSSGIGSVNGTSGTTNTGSGGGGSRDAGGAGTGNGGAGGSGIVIIRYAK